jgi:chromate transport protein ChrA
MTPTLPPPPNWSPIPNPLPTHVESYQPPTEPGPDRRGTYVGFKLPRWRRLVAELIDYVIPGALMYWDFGILGLAALIFVFANSGVYQGLTGHSLGKRLMGLKLAYGVIWKRTNRVIFCYPGLFRTLGRLFIDMASAVMLASTWTPLAFLLLCGVLFGRYRRSPGDWWMRTIVLPPSDLQLIDKASGQVSAMRAKNTYPV